MIIGDYFKNYFGFWGVFFNCSSIIIEVSEPLFSFFKNKKTQQKHNKMQTKTKTKRKQQKTEDSCFILVASVLL